jgi:serine/threonine-protein kinase
MAEAYEIRDRLARGGMANIFLAVDRNGEFVALRRLREELVGNRAAIKQFLWGNQVTARLKHPNIVQFISEGKTGKLPWTALEYVDGPNLRELILNDFENVKKQTMKLLLGMAQALNHVHEQGYLHLDFKPENILVPRDFNVRLIDFDLCVRKEDDLIKMKRIAGTPAYLPPELLQRKVVDERSDIFSFGVAAYEVLTGKKPIAAETAQQAFHSHATNEPIRKPREWNKNIPLKLDHFIMQCLAREVERRYPVMSLVIRDLRSCE